MGPPHSAEQRYSTENLSLTLAILGRSSPEQQTSDGTDASRSPNSCFADVAPAEIKHPMDKRQLIEEIRQFNATATLPFLQQFDEKDLQEYLSHLQAAARNDPRISGWVRKKPRFRMAS
jgi:hypothetical protein